MALSILTPAGAVVADPAVNDSDELSVSADGELVTVTADETPVENASVAVEPVDENATYTGTGEYRTDENGTVTLESATTDSVELEITATVDGVSETTTVTLEAAADSFGALVSQFVSQQQAETNSSIGLSVANFVLENNPGNAPAHAGPPEHAGPPSDSDGERTQGPPAHAGPNGNDADGEDADDSPANTGGPPAHAGPPSESSDDDDTDDRDDMESTDSGINDDNGGGPPDHAGPN